MKDDVIDFSFNIVDTPQHNPPPSKHILISTEALERALHRKEQNETYPPVQVGVRRVESNTVQSNPINEDRLAREHVSLQDAISASGSRSGSEDQGDGRLKGITEFWMKWATLRKPRVSNLSTSMQEGSAEARSGEYLSFYSIFDGHAGHSTAELLSKTLHAHLLFDLVAAGRDALENQDRVKTILQDT